MFFLSAISYFPYNDPYRLANILRLYRPKTLFYGSRFLTYNLEYVLLKKLFYPCLNLCLLVS
jgi:hypothetical protein